MLLDKLQQDGVHDFDLVHSLWRRKRFVPCSVDHFQNGLDIEYVEADVQLPVQVDGVECARHFQAGTAVDQDGRITALFLLQHHTTNHFDHHGKPVRYIPGLLWPVLDVNDGQL